MSWSFFSYSGHAEPDELLLDNSAAHGESLMEMLALCPNLKLVLLNGCSTAKLTQKGRELGIPVLIGTNCSVPDRDAMHFAVSLFGSLRDNNTSLRSAYDYAKSASRLENLPGANRAGRQSPPSDQIWDRFAIDESLLDKNFYRLCYLPGPVAFVNEKAGAPRIFFIHNSNGCSYYERIQDLSGLEDANSIASGSITSAFINGDSANIDWNSATEFWKAADAICLLVSDPSFISRFWPTLSNQIEKLRRDYPKPLFVPNIDVGKDPFSNFCAPLGACQVFPDKKIWDWLPSIQSMESPTNRDSGYLGLIKWLRDALSAPVDGTHLLNKLQVFNYNKQQTDLDDYLDSEASHQFILLEGSANCGQELLIKRLLERNELNFNIQHNKLQRLDFSGEEIQSAEQLWERIGATAAGKTVRQDIVQEVANRLQNQHLVIVLNRVHSAERDNGQLPQTRLILETFWQEWTAAFADVDTPHRLVIVAINRGYDEESGSGKLELTQKKQDKHHLLPLSPIRLLKGNYGKNTISDWHRNHNDGVFSPMEYQKLDKQRDSVLQDPHIKNVVHKICAVYQCEHICDQLFQL